LPSGPKAVRKKTKLNSDADCQWKSSSVRGKGFVLRGFPSDNGLSARFVSLLRKRARESLRYTVSFRGKTLRKGSFKSRTEFDRGKKAYRIYEGSDAFVNYCINKFKTIKSSGGRLYCYHPGYSASWLRYIWDLR
jgi:hypothetical protein